MYTSTALYYVIPVLADTEPSPGLIYVTMEVRFNRLCTLVLYTCTVIIYIPMLGNE